MTPRRGQRDTVWPGSVRNSSLPWRLSSPCPLEAGAVTAPLPRDGYMLVRPLLCQGRSRSVIFHYCCLSNVSILATFKSVCSPCHHWDLKKLSSSFPVQNLHEGLKPWETCRQKGKYQNSCLWLPGSPSGLTPFSILHPGHLFLASGQYWRNCFYCFEGSLASLEALKHGNYCGSRRKRFGAAFTDGGIHQLKRDPLSAERMRRPAMSWRKEVNQGVPIGRQTQWHKLDGFYIWEVLGSFGI